MSSTNAASTFGYEDSQLAIMSLVFVRSKGSDASQMGAYAFLDRHDRHCSVYPRCMKRENLPIGWGTRDDLLQLGKQPRRRAVTVPQRLHKQTNGSHTSCPSNTNSPDDVYIMPRSSSSASVSLSSIMSLEDDGDYTVPTATVNEAAGTALTLPASY